MSNLPKLRFKEFSGEWIEKPFGQRGKLINGLAYTKRCSVMSKKVKNFSIYGLYVEIIEKTRHKNKLCRKKI